MPIEGLTPVGYNRTYLFLAQGLMTVTLPIPWLRLVIFMLLAIAISTPFRFALVDWPVMQSTAFGVPVLRALLEGSGPILAVLIVTMGLRQYWQPVTFTGSSAPHALLMLLVPPVIFTLVGVPNQAGISPHWFGLALGGGTIIYCLFEEAGWRGFCKTHCKAGRKPGVMCW